MEGVVSSLSCDLISEVGGEGVSTSTSSSSESRNAAPHLRALGPMVSRRGRCLSRGDFGFIKFEAEDGRRSMGPWRLALPTLEVRRQRDDLERALRPS